MAILNAPNPFSSGSIVHILSISFGDVACVHRETQVSVQSTCENLAVSLSKMTRIDYPGIYLTYHRLKTFHLEDTLGCRESTHKEFALS